MQSQTGDVPAQTMKQFQMVDLHGNSISQSRSSVNRHIEIAYQSNTRKVRFVTGRGNHVNSRGERGAQYRDFRTWITPENQARISDINAGDGFYEVTVKPGKVDPTCFPFIEKMTDQWMKVHKDELVKSAEQNDANSQDMLGHCYEYGVGFEIDYKLAVKWYQKAADQKNKFAQYALGGCYWQGKGVRQNDLTAIELFKAAAAQKFAWAIHQLGDIYDYGWGVESDPKLALSYYQQAADLGLDIAKRKLAHALLKGEHIPKDEKKALQLYTEVADRGDGHAAYNVAFCCSQGLGAPINFPMAFKYAKQSADLNDPDAQFLVSTFYARGLGTGVDAALSFEYLNRSAANHFKHALFQLALHPKFKNDPKQKVNYIIAAAKAGHIIAQAMLLNQFPEALLSPTEREDVLNDFWRQDDSDLYDIQDPSGHFQSIVIDAYMGFDQLTHKQKQKIMRLLIGLEKQKLLPAYGRLGFIYSTDKIVTRDFRKTEHYWRQGSLLGCKDCACSLGYFFEQGLSGKVDYDESFKFHTLGAERGSANSHNQLGLYYKKGTGARKDLQKAISHFKEAMALDNDKTNSSQQTGLLYTTTYHYSAFNLGAIYWNGDSSCGFIRDAAQAIHWFKQAAEHGSEDAKKLLEKLEKQGMKIELPDSYKNIQKASFWNTGNTAVVGDSSAPAMRIPTGGNSAAESKTATENKSADNTLGTIARKTAINTTSNTADTRNGNALSNTSSKMTPGFLIKVTKPVDLLNQLTTLLNLKLAWNITDKDSAWGYLEEGAIATAKQYTDILKPIEIKKTQDGRSILALGEVSKKDIVLIVEQVRQHLANKESVNMPKP